MRELGPRNHLGRPAAVANKFTNSGFESDTTGWSASGTATITRSTSAAHGGAASLLVEVPANSDGATFAGTGNAGQGDTYTVSGRVQAVSTGGDLQPFVMNAGGTFEIFAGGVTSVVGAWRQFAFTFTWAEASHTGWVFTIRDASGGGKDFYLDDVQYESGSKVTAPPVLADGTASSRTGPKELAS